MQLNFKTSILFLILTCIMLIQFIPDLTAREPVRFGVNGGIIAASQHWDYPLIPFQMPDKKYRTGYMAFAVLEKPMSSILSIRAEAGYLQKGFKEELVFISPDGSESNKNRDNVLLHQAALGLALKVAPLKMSPLPYLLIGGRGEYMCSYTDIIITESGSNHKFGMYELILPEFDRYSLSALMAAGIELNDAVYVELEFNPAITRRFKDPSLKITDQAWGIKAGIYLSEIF